jgi:hypothetical protein
MSPELETLDQLLGGDLPLTVIHGLFNNGERFVGAILAMLEAGEVRLLTSDGTEVPPWQWQAVLNASCSAAASGARLAITTAGARRIG